MAAEASWLSESLLLVVGPVDLANGEGHAVLSANEDSAEASVRCIPLADPSGNEGDKVLTALVPDHARVGQAGELSLESAGEGDASTSSSIRVRALSEILEERLAGLPKDTAERVLEFISAAPAEHGLENGSRDLSLSNRLLTVRNGLRTSLQTVVIERDRPVSANTDLLVAVDKSSFYIQGWIRDAEAPFRRFTAVSPEGERVEILDRLLRFPLPQPPAYSEGPYREPVDAARFICFFETERPSHLRNGWVFELENEAGGGIEMYALPAVVDVASARTAILGKVPEEVLPNDQLMSEHLHPALSRLQLRARESVSVANVVECGIPAAAPEISIIVPLYKRLDLLEHQLTQFAQDPELSSAELIYVLDSPELANELAQQIRPLPDLYGVAFRVATMKENGGFAAANNVGASLARGRLLVLLNSDVLPSQPGWLGLMRAFYDSTERIGALGPKLLYEDDSLQHAGLFFETVQEGPTVGLWANMHYFKGLHKDLPQANVQRSVPAVTAACLMIDKGLYEEASGLPDVYVQGDYEDSDLCLKLLELGRENWYLPSAELYHLEGSSYSDEERRITGYYNRWLQTHRWGDAIADVMSRYPRL